jgi:hypothetical protein
VKTWFQAFAFKLNLYRYIEARMRAFLSEGHGDDGQAEGGISPHNRNKVMALERKKFQRGGGCTRVCCSTTN